MAKNKTITLTDELIKLVSFIKFDKFILDDKENYSRLKRMVDDLYLYDGGKAEIKQQNRRTLDEISSFDPHSHFGWAIDQWSLFGGAYVLEDIAMILGYMDQVIPGTESLSSGRRFPSELEEKMYGMYDYICDNMEDIFTIIFTFAGNGGVTPGTYEFIEGVWKKK